MISDENLAQIEALMIRLLEERGFKKLPTAHALRQRRYEERQKSVRGKASVIASAKRQKSVRNGIPFVLPEWVPVEQWNAWIEARTKKRNKPTVFAMKLAVSRLEEFRDQGQSPAAILAQAAFGGWTGLHPLKS